MRWNTFWTRNSLSLKMDIFPVITLTLFVWLMSAQFHGASAQQTFRIEPTDQQAIRGQTILLPCGIDYLVGSVTWMRDGFGLGQARDLPGYSRYRLDGAQDRGEYTLMISNLQLEDDATYECQIMATRTTPVLVSRPATVTVYIPPEDPVIEKGPVVEVTAGEPYNLTCRAENGKPAATMSWFKGTLPILKDVFYEVENQTDGSKLQNATGWVTIVPRKADQGKKYYCEAHNEATQMGTPKSTSATLEVLYPPEVSMVVSPRYNNLDEGDPVKFTCDAYGNPSTMIWSWFQGGVHFEGETSHILVRKIDHNWHNTKVECEANNTVDAVRQSVTLNVRYPPRFTSGPQHVAADVGDDATLSCAVNSNPAPTIIWVKQGEERILSSSLTWTLRGVREETFGVYLCKASTLNSEPIVMAVHLLKKGVPRILSHHEQSARYGETGVIECTVRSVPKPQNITWEKDGVEIDFKKLGRYHTREEDLPDGKRSIVEITSVQDGDYGAYNCTVDNGLGIDEMSITFVERDVIPLEYIIAGVLVGVFIIIIIAVVIVVYHRKRAASSDSDSDTSESTISKKKDGIPPYKDPWLPSDPYDYRDHGDIYGSHYGGAGPGYARSDYGTYPGPARNNIYDVGPYGSQNIYGGPAYSDYGIYGTYGGPHRPPPPRSDFIPASELGRPSTAMSNRLATNV